jgi:DNA-binding MarR family transcriptional regulator
VTVEWLDADERAAWIRLAAVMELLPAMLDSQLRREAGLTYFEYLVLAMLSEAPDRVLRMTSLAAQTNATLARLSHVVSRLEERGLVQRQACPEDRRATNTQLTEQGWTVLEAAAPGHVTAVRQLVFDGLDPDQVGQLSEIFGAILTMVDPQGVMTAHALS